MQKFRKTIYVLFLIIGALAALCSLLSVFRNSDIRYFKMLDFPRIQFFITSVFSLIILAITIRKKKWYDIVIILGLVGGLLVNGSFLINYTFLVSKTVPTATLITSSDTQLSLLLVNVKMKNRDSEKLIDIIERKKPDIILAMEVNKWWDNELKTIQAEYPYIHETINDVAYGMTLYSKFPLNNIDVDYLHNKNVPSFECKIALAHDKIISFHSIHPVPPTHFQEYPDNAGQKEVAMKKLGEEIKAETLPIIVAGDLNDVVWSYVDQLTGTEGIIHDVREGRDFYNSYNAKHFYMRWPLDHVFVSKEFRLKKIERLPKIGSDHFPVYVELVL